MLYPSTLPNLDRLWSDGNPHNMERKLRDLIEPARTVGVCAYYLQLLTQIARAQAQQGRYAAGHATLDEVAAQLTDGLQAARVRYLLERGRILQLEARRDEADAALLEARRVAVASGYYNVADAATQLLEAARQKIAS